MQSGRPPAGVPFALHLTDDRGAYRLLALDFDAHAAGSTATADASDCSAALSAAGVSHLVCSSGPGGGVHLWIRLAGPTATKQVARLAAALTAAYPSLDSTPLTGGGTACVRAPGSPHRAGGASTPLSDPAITPVDFRDLSPLLDHARRRASSSNTAPDANQVPASTTVSTPPAIQVLTDLVGGTYLAGPRRPLAPALRGLARTPLPADGDASATGWSILLGLAHSRARLADVVDAALAQSWPGLEYLRTHRRGDGTRDRHPNPHAVISRQWAKAVHAASLTPARTSTPSIDRQATDTHLAAVHAHLTEQPHRWRGKTGEQDRLLLCALIHRCHHAARTSVHLSQRDWALACGLTRDIVATRIRHLRAQGWIRQVRPATGPWAAEWTPELPGGGETGSGAVFSPLPVEEIAAELAQARHDVWCAPLLGVLGRRVWACLAGGRGSTAEIAARAGVSAPTARSKIAALRAAGLVTSCGRAYTGRRRLAAAARALGVDGAHADRRRVYQLQSAVFVWWFTSRYQPEDSDAIAEWGAFPDPVAAAEAHPVDIALAYGPTSRGAPPEATCWGAAMLAMDTARHLDPDTWWHLVRETRAALPAPDVLTAPHTWADDLAA